MSKLVGGPFKTALEVSEQRKQQFRISTGSAKLDDILGGGIESQNLTEAYGEYRSGKTQLSHTLSVSCQVEKPGYTPGKALFMDTENTFRPERLKQIARRFNLDEESVLENVTVARCYTTDHQIELLGRSAWLPLLLSSRALSLASRVSLLMLCPLTPSLTRTDAPADYVAGKFNDERGVYRLWVIDSVMALFRVDFSGRGELAERQQRLGQFLARVSRIAEEFNVAVFMTNQMTADPGNGMSFQADPKKPIGGNILGHASTVRIYLRKGKGNDRLAKVVDAPDLPEKETVFGLSEGGVGEAVSES